MFNRGASNRMLFVWFTRVPLCPVRVSQDDVMLSQRVSLQYAAALLQPHAVGFSSSLLPCFSLVFSSVCVCAWVGGWVGAWVRACVRAH